MNTFTEPSSSCFMMTPKEVSGLFKRRAKFDGLNLQLTNSNINGKELDWMLKGIEKVIEERMRQDEKFPPDEETNISDKLMLAVLMEEVGEVANALLEHDYDNVDTEIIQVAAVCVKWWALRRLEEQRKLSPIQKLAKKFISWIQKVVKIEQKW